MHIGFTIYGNLGLQTGGFRYDRKLVEYLESQGDKVSVIALPWRSYAPSLLDNLTSVPLQMHRKAEEHEAFDILIQDELAHPSLLGLNRILKRQKRFPIVSLVHLLHYSSQPWASWRRELYKKIEKIYLATLDGFIYVSNYNRSKVEALLDSSPPGVVAYPGGNHLHNDLSAQEIGAKALQPGPLKLVFVGSVVQRKAPHTIVEALSHLPIGNFTLTLIGSLDSEPEYVRRLDKQIKTSGLGGMLRFSGALPNHRVGEELAKSHLLVLPSYAEGYPAVCVEAMSYGVPVITTSASGAVELVRDGKNGFLLETGDAAALAAHLDLLHENRRILAEMSYQAHLTYRKHPTWEDAGQGIRNFLLEQTEVFYKKTGSNFHKSTQPEITTS